MTQIIIIIITMYPFLFFCKINCPQLCSCRSNKYVKIWHNMRTKKWRLTRSVHSNVIHCNVLPRPCTHRQGRVKYIYTVRHKKLHHFVFAITLSYLSLFEYLLVHINRDKFGTNWHQNHQSHLKGVFILLCEIQHTYTCYDQRRFSLVGLNVITIVLNI